MNHTDLDAAVVAAQNALIEAGRRRARAEADHDAAVAREKTLRERLRTEFGIFSVEQARTALADLEQQLQTCVVELTTALEEAETS